LPGLLFSAAVMPDLWERRVHAAVARGVAAEFGFWNGRTLDDGEGEVNDSRVN
jgi:hypothetical protein